MVQLEARLSFFLDLRKKPPPKSRSSNGNIKDMHGARTLEFLQMNLACTLQERNATNRTFRRTFNGSVWCASHIRLPISEVGAVGSILRSATHSCDSHRVLIRSRRHILILENDGDNVLSIAPSRLSRHSILWQSIILARRAGCRSAALRHSGIPDRRSAGYIYEGTWSYTLIYRKGTRPPLLLPTCYFLPLSVFCPSALSLQSLLLQA